MTDNQAFLPSSFLTIIPIDVIQVKRPRTAANHRTQMCHRGLTLREGRLFIKVRRHCHVVRLWWYSISADRMATKVPLPLHHIISRQ